jgi:glycolate oxidase FAD binding subunit
VVRAQAGLTVEALAEALAARGQELAVDVPVPGTTVGGLVATAIAGPRRFRYGTPRDLLIGITVVLADGTIAKSGGKVVKNVAGYDLGKLFTGSYGSLGVVVDATFRLHPLPASRAWVTAPFAPPATDPAGDLGAALAALAASQNEPSAIEIDWPDLDVPCAVAALVEGSAAGNRAEALRDLLGERAGVTGEPPGWWGALPCGNAGSETLIEVRTAPARVVHALGQVAQAAAEASVRAAVRGSAASGVLHVAPATGTSPSETAAFVGVLRDEVEGAGGRVVVLTAPQEAARHMDRWGRIGALTLMRRIKERFDPDGRLSPGRFAGGI